MDDSFDVLDGFGFRRTIGECAGDLGGVSYPATIDFAVEGDLESQGQNLR